MKKEYRKLKKLIKQNQKILLLTHKGPDTDAFCSVLLTYKFIKEGFPDKDVRVLVQNTPSFKVPLAKELTIKETIEVGDEDLVIITDTPELKLSLDNEEEIRGGSKKIVLIDHHRTERPDSDITVLINEQRSSATEQVFATFKELLGRKFKIDQEVATLTQLGIVGDTGRFLYDSTTRETFEIFAETKKVYSADLEEFTYKSAKFPQEATPVIIQYLKSLTIEKDMAYMYISKDIIEENDFTKQGVNEAMAFLRDNYIRFMQGVHWGFIIRPNFDKENIWDVSFRSTKGYQDVEIIAKELEGGGHQYSSGIRLERETVQEVVDSILEVINSLDS